MSQYSREVRRLKTASRLASRIHERINYRVREQALLQQMIEMAHEGKVYFVESGRDCDGVQYDGYVRSCEPTLASYNEMVDELNNWADGPFFLDLVSHEVAQDVCYSSCDLSMEAFEDGHSHILYTR